MEYLIDLPSTVCNETGLAKTLMTRRETIRLKHLMTNIFVKNVIDREEFENKLKVMQFYDLHQYISFLTNRLRGIYNYPRGFHTDDVDDIVKQRKTGFYGTMRLYETTKPIIVCDFDGTITQKWFHKFYNWLAKNNFSIYINTANPSREAILNYLIKHELALPDDIHNNRGKQKKIVNLKQIAMKTSNRPLFYIDDEIEYIEYAELLFYQCYLIDKNKLRHKSLNKA